MSFNAAFLLKRRHFFMKITLENQFLDVFKTVEDKLGKENTYLVGGFIRDSLLKRESKDMDFCTPLLPDQVFLAFPYSTFFKKYGTVSFKLGDINITIASFRKEKGYSDFRHPSTVTFVHDLKSDYKRRDFTINCLYMDSNFDIIDPTRHGIRDLTKKNICLIGNNKRRLQEDPLRILRAYRFSYELGFSISRKLEKAIQLTKYLVKELKPQKVREEVNKCPAQQRKNLVSNLSLEFAYDV